MNSPAVRYWILMLVQVSGAGIILWQGVPFYRRMLLRELETNPQTMITFWAILAVVLIQSTFWSLRRLPVANVPMPAPFLAYVVLFIARAAFIYVAGLFATVFYIRHADVRFVFRHEVLLVAVTFSMYCFTTELERLGRVLLGAEADHGHSEPRIPPSG